ncbi:hypothetical protein BUE80_DR001554 [Diplocarpon rosae]|nr:hypothetical protein BUE80_DR001554 [Diplocarpon rosae]
MWPFPSDVVDENYIRAASPNERRCIVREYLGFYRALIVGGVFEFAESVDTKSVSTYIHALRQCIDRHPQLSVTISNVENESPYYVFCPQLDLGQHIEILDHSNQGGESEIRAIQQALPSILDAKWPASVPAWKIIVLPFSDRRCFVGFSFSHAIGDGVSGLAFNRTFLDALQERYVMTDLTYKSTRKPFNQPFDTAKNLTISWSFLLKPLLGAYFPKWIATLCGGVQSLSPGTWTGVPIFYDPETYKTGVEILTIDANVVEDALKLCRMHGAKLTGLLHQLIISALSDCLPEPHMIDSFSSGTAMNMRRQVNASNDDMGLFVSVDYQNFSLQKTGVNHASNKFSWDLAKSVTERLAVKSQQLHDQPIGLLRYLTSVHSWTLSKLGARREGSYELSNLANFRPLGSVDRCSVTVMLFCQPADVTGGPPLTFNVVSATGGPLTIAVSWQIGALGFGLEREEVEFVKHICNHIRSSLARLSKSSDI